MRVCIANMAKARAYDVEPILPHFGAVVKGFSLDGQKPLAPAVVDQIREDVKNYRILVFKGQGKISGARQVQVTKQLGEIESTFFKHPRSPHPDIFRVSNDPCEGCLNVGRTGWHIDGTFLPMPFKYQTMHFHSVCEGGETWFVPLNEFYESQDEETKERWNQLWMVPRTSMAHPFVYKHPVRGDVALLFHCGSGFAEYWLRDMPGAVGENGGTVRRALDHSEMQEELTLKLDAIVDTIGIKMQWEEGDFAINDNLGNCHYASPGTQTKRAIGGLRILHRTTVAGETVPTKHDGVQTLGSE
mmetsp:Transcript_22908/g.52496  ORF Transcript_22908/g.52496 Transcript_22908/m.52496 type:complete len:301 (-) Transcript_22908:21-923(-)